MASSSKKKTTMSKLNRERKLRERRLDKQARKDARKHPAVYQEEQPRDAQTTGDDGVTSSDGGPDAGSVGEFGGV